MQFNHKSVVVVGTNPPRVRASLPTPLWELLIQDYFISFSHFDTFVCNAEPPTAPTDARSIRLNMRSIPPPTPQYVRKPPPHT